MSDPTPESKTNAAEFTVSEISIALKRTVEDAFGYVRVRGEISGYRGPHSSGHAYFAMKDDRARIEAVVWKGTMARIKVRPEEGMEVIATGKLTTFPGSSKYQIVIDNLEPAGVGALMALVEERKKRLAAEGLFDPARKQLLPHMPRVIGVITSPTGAVIRDIVHRIRDRFPLHLLVWPVRVQGETCAAEVTAAVVGFNALPHDGAIPRPDLIIVARGGGSLEDLWGFNDEALARAVAQSDLPVISAVGHETDWTLIDLVADVRAPTPTGAAEMAVPVRDDLDARLTALSARLRAAARRSLERRRTAFRSTARALPSLDQMLALPRRRFDETTSRLERGLSVSLERKRARWASLRLQPTTLTRRIAEAQRRMIQAEASAAGAIRARLRDRRMRCDRASARVTTAPLLRAQRQRRQRLADLVRRIGGSFVNRAEKARARLTHADRLLSTLSHRAILARGFVLVTAEDGTLIRSATGVTNGRLLSLTFSDGSAEALGRGKVQDGNAARSGNRREKSAATSVDETRIRGRKPRDKNTNQGSLF